MSVKEANISDNFGHCKIVMRYSLQRSDIVKTHLELQPHPQDYILNIGQKCVVSSRYAHLTIF